MWCLKVSLQALKHFRHAFCSKAHIFLRPDNSTRGLRVCQQYFKTYNGHHSNPEGKQPLKPCCSRSPTTSSPSTKTNTWSPWQTPGWETTIQQDFSSSLLTQPRTSTSFHLCQLWSDSGIPFMQTSSQLHQWTSSGHTSLSFHMKSPDFQKSSHMTLFDFLLISLKCYPYSQTEKFQISGPYVFSFSRSGLRKLRCTDLFFIIK